MNAQVNGPKRWHLNTFGDFRLENAGGQAIELANRKVEALLAILAVHRHYGIGRDSVAEILWPGRPLENQRTNLRQALSVLKRALVDGALETSRTHLRLSETLELDCDYNLAPANANAVFMPDHEGDWFDQIRLEASSDLEAAPPPILLGLPGGRSVVGNFCESVEMLALADPRGMFDQLRANPSMARGIPFPIFRNLLDRYGKLEAVRGWADFWRGTILEDLTECATYLRSAMREAKRTQDYELASEVSLELGRVYCRTGNLEKAEKICRIAENIADLTKARGARAIADRLRGTCLIHWSDSKRGLLLLQRTEELTEDVVGRTHLIAARALFCASVGDHRRASDLIASVSRSVPILGHTPTLLLTGLTRSLLSIEGGRLFDAVPELERVARWSLELDITQTAVYAQEILERIYDRSGEKALSRSLMVSAQLGRKKAQMIRTPVEARRLTLVQ